MKIEIKKNENEIIAQFKKEKLIISEKSQEWTNEGITRFLTNLAISTPDDEKLEIVYDTNSKDDVYKHICNLFEEFIKEYNMNWKQNHNK